MRFSEMRNIQYNKAMHTIKAERVILQQSKAKLQKEGIFFPHPFICQDILLMKKLEIEETKTT